MFCVFFFFKQKTAYEMRISDWSSDVCSSDLAELNYAPNVSARALAGGDDRRVALLYRNTTTSAYLGELLLGGLDEAAKHHLHLVVEQCETGDRKSTRLNSSH